MPHGRILLTTLALLILGSPATESLQAQTRETTTVTNAASVLDEVMQIPARKIPDSLLTKAEALVIIPNMVKGGFIVGVRHGRGVALTRDEKRNWKAPRLLRMTGGSVGFQAGVQATDVILVFMTKKSVDGLLGGKITIGADAAAAAGPVGRQIAAATDERLKAEILSYSRSRGLFAGVSLDGSSIQIDPRAEVAFYGPPQDGKFTTLPEAAARLVQTASKYSGTATGPTLVESKSTSATTPEATRKQLADASIRLSAVLPEDWKKYLALPAEVYDGKKHASLEGLTHVRARYDAVAKSNEYRALTTRDEFKKVHVLLRQYESVLTPKATNKLQLPPAPKNER